MRRSQQHNGLLIVALREGDIAQLPQCGRYAMLVVGVLGNVERVAAQPLRLVELLPVRSE